MGSKLHELLAVEGDVKGVAKNITQETITTLSKKPEHFISTDVNLEYFDQDKQKENWEEHHAMVTTVRDKLNYVEGHLTRFFDVLIQKERTNQLAKADLIVDGITLGVDVPATCLLNLETELKGVRAIYEAIPTLAPGKEWLDDPDAGKGVHRARYPEVKFKTAKTFMHKILVQPTEKHPAQVEKWEENINVGRYSTVTRSSMLSPAEKSHFLGRIDKLIQGCKQARQRANCQEVVTDVSIGDKLFGYING